MNVLNIKLIKDRVNHLFRFLIAAIFLLLYYSCAVTNLNDSIQRVPAGDNSSHYSDDLERIFTFNVGKNISPEESDGSLIKDEFEGKSSQVKFNFVLDKNLPSNVSFKLEPEIMEYDIDVYHYYKDIYTIRYSDNSFRDLDSIKSLDNLLNRLLEFRLITQPDFRFQETILNAKLGDPNSLKLLLNLRGTLDDPEMIALGFSLDKRIEALKKEQKILKVKRKELLEELDNLDDSKQFRNLVANNDKKGVGNLLRKYLPWEDMAPIESKFWNNYLDVLENPLPLEKKVLVYRGIDDDYFHPLSVDGKRLSQDDALRESKGFLMSTILVKNQGSWNRRLRSLESMNNKYIGTIVDGDSTVSSTARISTMFYKHSLEPKGSPFLSFTPGKNTSYLFGKHKAGIFLIDPRLLMVNAFSGFKGELEFLLPFAVFPDEVVGIVSKEHGLHTAELDNYIKKFIKFIKNNISKNDQKDTANKILSNTESFFKEKFDTEKYHVAINKEFDKIANTSVDESSKAMSPNHGKRSKNAGSADDLSCKDILSLIWMKM